MGEPGSAWTGFPVPMPQHSAPLLLLFLWVLGLPAHVTGVKDVCCALRLLGTQYGFPHGKRGLEEELGCGISFTKPTACHSWKVS